MFLWNTLWKEAQFSTNQHKPAQKELQNGLDRGLAITRASVAFDVSGGTWRFQDEIRNPSGCGSVRAFAGVQLVDVLLLTAG